MSRHRSRTSQQRQSEFAESFACEFDAAAIHNTVWETVDEDADLARLCDAVAAADEALAVRVDDAFAAKLDEAWGRLDWVARQRALEVVVEACAVVITDGEQWVTDGHWDAEEITDAQTEAQDWMATHTEIAERAGVLTDIATHTADD
ncbi:hypothetical protein [Haloarcula sp. JP-L23]|uniref:hypothetical protein n=1 Tax=Haloarcula sp. JP-L23 TaxID=2716717 RepID=UPI00140EDD38|nr:hypothetical protein G9465_23810 [Haloarcula sp. JP-L23]